MTTFRINKYIYLHKTTPTPQGLVTSSIDRDASEWTKYPKAPLQLTMDTTAEGGLRIKLMYENTTLETLDTEAIDLRFGSLYGKNNPPLVAICKQQGIGFKYLVQRFHTMTYRFQIKFAFPHEYEQAVEMLSNGGVSIKGRPKKTTSTTLDDTQTSFKDFNPESVWAEEDEGDITQIDPMLMSQTQPSATLVDTPGSSQNPYQLRQTSRPSLPSYQPSYQPKRFSETSTWKRPAQELSSPEISPVNSVPNSPKRARSWKQHFTPNDTDIRTENGMVSRGTQTEEPEWLTDSRAMERHIVEVVQNPSFSTYVARIKELMRAEGGLM